MQTRMKIPLSSRPFGKVTVSFPLPWFKWIFKDQLPLLFFIFRSSCLGFLLLSAVFRSLRCLISEILCRNL